MRFAYTNPVITVGTAQQGRLDFAPLAGNTLCVGRRGFDETGLHLRRRLLECWRMAYALWSDWGNGAGVLFGVKPKEQLANRPITCDYSERVALNAQKALREASKTLGQKTKSDTGKGLPMEEENEYTGMTAGEMQRFLDAEAEQGASELEAYRKLMRILEVEFPSKE